jgi:hypothetical protein
MACEETGRAAVYPMMKPEVLIDKLTRANERLRVIDEVESVAKQLDSAKEKWTDLTGQEKI